ncbi:MAG TPA: ATP-binding protein [Actinomycetota bacterium]|nr:ATP-binding protein [Actinomycetota bacterium]
MPGHQRHLPPGHGLGAGIPQPVRHPSLGIAGQALATSTDLSLYRIVQEALTNALKQAKAARAEVVVGYGTHDITVEVSDDGRGAAPGRGAQGAGTIGMRERVALFGGELQAGPRPQGGYAVRVCLPIPAEEP